MITITHTHEDGTTLAGSHRGDGVFDIVKAHGFRYSRTVGIYLRGSRDRDAQRWRIEAAATALREKGFEVSVDIDDAWRPAAQREQARAERADERADRLDDRASAAAGRRDARQAAADRVLDAIPAGQPMLVDHHSYRADRNRRERAWANLDKALVEDRTARQLAGRADGVRANEDAKDNPRAIMRRIESLTADLRRWQREQAEADTVGASESYRDRVRREIGRLTEDIAHQEQKLADRAATGEFVAWGPDHLATGDLVRVGGHGWYRVTRVNRKSVSLNSPVWPQRITFDKIFGRRRDGLQHDAPNGEGWPVALAVAVEKWARLLRAASNPGYDRDQQRQARHVRYAQRLVHGLDLSAADAQVAAFWPADDTADGVAVRRRLAAAYLAVFTRLEADEPVPAIVASLAPDPAQPVWRLPDGDPVDRHPADLRPGDLIAGWWQRGGSGRELWTGFVGPVAHVGAVEHRGDGRGWVAVILTDGTARELKTGEWLAVHPGPPARP